MSIFSCVFLCKYHNFWITIVKTKAETPVLWPPHAKSWLIGKDWCWERSWAGGEGDYRGWDGWMASPTWWTWVWVNSGSWWWTGRPGVLQFMGSQRAGPDWATELNWSETKFWKYFYSDLLVIMVKYAYNKRHNLLIHILNLFFFISSESVENLFSNCCLIEMCTFWC